MIKHELTSYFHHKVKDYMDFLMNKDHLKFGFLLELHTYVTFQEIIKYQNKKAGKLCLHTLYQYVVLCLHKLKILKKRFKYMLSTQKKVMLTEQSKNYGTLFHILQNSCQNKNKANLSRGYCSQVNDFSVADLDKINKAQQSRKAIKQVQRIEVNLTSNYLQ